MLVHSSWRRWDFLKRDKQTKPKHKQMLYRPPSAERPSRDVPEFKNVDDVKEYLELPADDYVVEMEFDQAADKKGKRGHKKHHKQTTPG